MTHLGRILLAMLVCTTVWLIHPGTTPAEPDNEARLLTRTRQITFAGRRAGEGYFSTDGKRMIFQSERESVVLEKSNVAALASYLYLLVHALRQEDHHDTDDASAGEIYPILVSKSTVSAVQSARRRQHRASIVDRHAQTHRTAALHRMRPGVL